MDLTGEPFIWAMRVALVAVVGWIVVRWPKAAGPGILAIGRRLAAIVLVVALGTLNVLLPVNAEYGWFDSWADLGSAFSPAPLVAATATQGAPAASSTARPVGSSPLAGLPTSGRDRLPLALTDTSHGGYQEFTVPGRTSGFTGQVTVWLPPSYTDPANARREYPVLEGLHGFLPAPLAFFNVFHLDRLIADEVRGGRMQEPILVIPHWAPGKVDTECVDGGKGRPAIETWLAKDVPAWAYENFRVRSDRQSWATIGASAGGWCGLMATMLHPRTFSAAISLGGYTRPDFTPPYIPFKPGSSAWRRYDLVRLAASKPPAVALWVMSSKPDRFAFAQSSALVRASHTPLSVTPTFVPTGGHRSEVWQPYLPVSLRWLAATSRGFTPDAR